MTVTVNSAVPSLPDPSLAIAVQTTSIFSVTNGAVKVLSAKLPPFVHVTVGPDVTATLSVTVKVEISVLPDETDKIAGLNARAGAVISGEILTDKTAVFSFPAASLTVAVQSLVVADVTTGAVNVPPEKAPPFVHVMAGPDATPTLSETDRVDKPVPPPITESVVGLKEATGAVSSTIGVTVTVKLSEAEFPAASLTVTVHTTVVSMVTSGAVKVLPEKLPPFVHENVGPDVMPTLSELVTVEAPV